MADLVIRSLSELKKIVVEKMDEGTVLSVSFVGKEADENDEEGSDS